MHSSFGIESKEELFGTETTDVRRANPKVTESIQKRIVDVQTDAAITSNTGAAGSK